METPQRRRVAVAAVAVVLVPLAFLAGAAVMRDGPERAVLRTSDEAAVAVEPAAGTEVPTTETSETSTTTARTESHAEAAAVTTKQTRPTGAATRPAAPAPSATAPAQPSSTAPAAEATTTTTQTLEDRVTDVENRVDKLEQTTTTAPPTTTTTTTTPPTTTSTTFPPCPAEPTADAQAQAGGWRTLGGPDGRSWVGPGTCLWSYDEFPNPHGLRPAEEPGPGREWVLYYGDGWRAITPTD
jgi:hypothetical protein